MTQPQQGAGAGPGEQGNEAWQYPAPTPNPTARQHAPLPVPGQPAAPQSGWQPGSAPGPQPWGVPGGPPPGVPGAAPSGPPPRRKVWKTVVGGLLLVVGLLSLLGTLGRIGQGTFVLFDPRDVARSIGALAAMLLFLVLPLLLGVRLLSSHRRAMDRWRRGGR